jgi:predicted ATPase with chaperone activity
MRIFSCARGPREEAEIGVRSYVETVVSPVRDGRDVDVRVEREKKEERRRARRKDERATAGREVRRARERARASRAGEGVLLDLE